MTTYQSQSTRVRQLFSTLAAATASNPVLLEGEKWNEKSATTGRFTGRTKTGDGVVTGTAPNQTISGTAFNALPFDPTSGGGDPAGTADAAIAAHVAAADPHPTYTTVQEAAAAAPVQSVALTPPSGWSASAANVGGSVTLTLALPAGYSLPSNASQANWDTAHSERLRWDGSASGLNAATGRASLELGSAAMTDAANLLPRTIETVDVAYAATIDIDFSANNGKTLIVGTLTGPVTFTFSNIAQGRNVSVDLLCDSTQRALTFPAATPFVGPKPSNVAASKAATLTFECRRPGTTDASVRAAYGVQP